MSALQRIIKRPLLTEKSNLLKGEQNQVVFVVDRRAGKQAIQKAVEKLFKVEVKKVNTFIVHGKFKTMGRYRGRKANWKKAIVTLKEGQNLEFFEGV